MRPEPKLEELSAYLDGELGPDARRELEAHMTTCEACRERLSSLRSTVGFIQALPREVPYRAFTIPAQRPRRRPSFVPLAWASGAAAAMLVVVVVAGSLNHGIGGGGTSSSNGAASKSVSGGLGQGAAAPESRAYDSNGLPTRVTVTDPQDSRYSLTLSHQVIYGSIPSPGPPLQANLLLQTRGSESAVAVPSLVLERNGVTVMDISPKPAVPATVRSFDVVAYLSSPPLPSPPTGDYMLVARWTDPDGTALVAQLAIRISG